MITTRMTARLLPAAGLALSLMLGSMIGAKAATIEFQENFSGSSEGGYGPGSSGGTGVIGGTQFKVLTGDVDVIGPANYTCVANAAIKCVDLIGSSGQGTIQSTVGIDLHAGDTYTISYTDVLQGFATGSSPSLAYTVSLGSHVFPASSVPSVALMSFMFTASVDELGALLTFATIGNIDNVHGPVISGITVSSVASTPIPAALPLFASALGGLGFVGWRRRKSARSTA